MRREIRHRNRKNYTFTVRAQNLNCREAIIEKAEKQKIDVKKGGRPKLRLYFACSQGEWRLFHHLIKQSCAVEERPVMCHCPQWLQKVILKNLYATARKGMVSPLRAKKASQILKCLGRC